MNTRPLDKISNFVMNELPGVLETSPATLHASCSSLLTQDRDILTALNGSKGTNECKVALLDLKMLEAGIVHSGFTPPTELVSQVNELSGTSVQGLTYEDLILVNPREDMRAFTQGEVGGAEIKFYTTHAKFEVPLGKVIGEVEQVVGTLLAGAAIPALDDTITSVTNYLNEGIVLLESLLEMNPGHFTAFRKYLNSHPTRELKGPSGAFTASIPILEIMTCGDDLPPKYFNYPKDNLKYFPQSGQTKLKEVIEMSDKKNTLVSLWRRQGSNPTVGRLIEVIGTFFNDFRGVHLKLVGTEIPEALRGELAGTGGESNPGTFLLERIKMTRFENTKGS